MLEDGLSRKREQDIDNLGVLNGADALNLSSFHEVNIVVAVT